MLTFHHSFSTRIFLDTRDKAGTATVAEHPFDRAGLDDPAGFWWYLRSGVTGMPARPKTETPAPAKVKDTKHA